MIFIDKNYYDNDYSGIEISENDFKKYAARASDTVNFLTFGRAENILENKKISDVLWQKKYEAIRKATAAQTEVFAAHGESSYTGKASSDITREELGNSAVSYNISRKEMREFFGIPISGLAIEILSNAGLLYRGI